MKKGDFVVDGTIGIALLFASLFEKKKGRYVIITTNLYNAQKIADSLSSFISNDNILLYPSDDALRLELLSSSKDFLAQRIYVLNELIGNKDKIIVTHISSLLSPLPKKEEFVDSLIHIKVGDSLDPIKLKEKL